jgi:multicomponent Na+:H+ antiporter subunit G
MGQVFVLVGLFIYEGFSFESIKLWLIILFIFIANPTATHAVAKAAYLAGLKPWLKSPAGSSNEGDPTQGGHHSSSSKPGDAIP